MNDKIISFSSAVIASMLVLFAVFTYINISHLQNKIDKIFDLASSTQAIASSTQPVIGVGAQASVNIWDLIVEQAQTNSKK